MFKKSDLQAGDKILIRFPSNKVVEAVVQAGICVDDNVIIKYISEYDQDVMPFTTVLPIDTVVANLGPYKTEAPKAIKETKSLWSSFWNFWDIS